jgi:hypothetical protein
MKVTTGLKAGYFDTAVATLSITQIAAAFNIVGGIAANHSGGVNVDAVAAAANTSYNSVRASA